MTVRYPKRLRILHWVTVALVAIQVSFVLLHWGVYESKPILSERLIQAHISVGVLVFWVTLIRLIERLKSGAPSGSRTLKFHVAARVVHVMLYACLLILPVTGYVRLASLGFQLEPFGFVPLPTLPIDFRLAQMAAALHDYIAVAFLALIGLHIVAALHHRRLAGVGVMHRMTWSRFR